MPAPAAVPDGDVSGWEVGSDRATAIRSFISSAPRPTMSAS